MKPFVRFFSLTLAVTAIVLIFLLPKLNKAENMRYTRIYEDTDARKEAPAKSINTGPEGDSALLKKAGSASSQISAPEEGRKKKKVYKKESIPADLKLYELKADMYSRAIHFVPEDGMLLLPDTSAVTDTTINIQ